MGRAAHSSFTGGKQIVAASAIKIDGSRFGSDGVHTADGSKQPYEEPRELKTEEIPDLIATFARAAAYAKEAGFDGIEIHSANGYLLNTFLETGTNKRTDKYGGSLENRVRLLHEVIDATSQSFPLSRIGVRLSPNGVYNDMGSADNIEVYTFVLKSLAKRGLMYTHVMDGLAFGFHKLTEPFTIEQIRKIYGEGTLVANCGYDRDSGEKAVAAGHADLVAYGRPFIANPDLPYRYAHDVPLAEPNPATWFTHDDVGYADYPTYLEQQEQEKNSKKDSAEDVAAGAEAELTDNVSPAAATTTE